MNANTRIRYRGFYVFVKYVVVRDGYIATVEKKNGENVWSSTRDVYAYPDWITAECAAKRIIDELRAE